MHRGWPGYEGEAMRSHSVLPAEMVSLGVKIPGSYFGL